MKWKSDFSFVTSSLHMCDSSRANMVRALLRPYEYRAWAQSNWVLVRIWQGCGFAFRYHKSPHLLRKLGPKLLQEQFSLISQSLSMCFFLVVTYYERLIYHWSSKVQRWLVHIINIVNWATAIISSRSFIFLLFFLTVWANNGSFLRRIGAGYIHMKHDTAN